MNCQGSLMPADYYYYYYYYYYFVWMSLTSAFNLSHKPRALWKAEHYLPTE